MSRWSAIGLGIALAATIVFAQELSFWIGSDWARAWAFDNGDLVGYLAGARLFIETGSPYSVAQLAGHWQLEPHSFIHPPIALALFIPFLILPSALWWAIPIAGTAFIIVKARPSPWRFAMIAICLIWPRSIGAILAGNSDLWAMLIVAVGWTRGWPLAFLAFKPSFGPIALLGISDWRTWAVGVGALAVSLPLLGQWLSVIGGSGADPLYSLGGLPLVLISLPAFVGRTWEFSLEKQPRRLLGLRS